MTRAIPAPTPNGHAPATAVIARPTRKPPNPPALPAPPTLLAAIIQASSDPAVDVGKVRELVELHKTLQEREWQRAFNEAMTACQADLQPVARNQQNTSTNSRYADLAKLAESALPIIHRHGFALTFGEVATPKPDHIGVAVRVSHRDGHVERTEFHVPGDVAGFKGTPNKTAIHGWGSALTYCRRYALLCSFNLIVAGDDDGNAAGTKPASSAQLKRDQAWQRYVGVIAAAKTFDELRTVWHVERFTIKAWPSSWREQAVEVLEKRKAALGGTTAALHESLRQLEDTAHDRDRWERNRQDAPGKW